MGRMYYFELITWVLIFLVTVVCLVGILLGFFTKKNRKNQETDRQEELDRGHRIVDWLGFVFLVLVVVLAMCSIAELVMYF